MTWSKLDDNIFDHPKMLKAGEDAANLYVRGLVYCNRYLTDGHIPAEALVTLSRKREAARYSADLVRVGLWETHPDGGWTVHDFHDHNPTAAEVAEKRAAIAAKRSEAGKRGGKRSGETRSNEAKRKQDAAAGAKQNEANDKQPRDEATKQNASPIPDPSSEGSKEPLSPAPKAPTTGTPLELTPPKEKAPRKATKPPADPPPFDPLAAYEAIASTAAGRFAVGQKSEWDGGHVIRARVLIRKFPDLATWSLVGAWLASGVMSFRGTLSVGWVAKSFAESVTLARDWDAKGRPAGGANRAPDPYAPKPAPVARVVTPSTVNADLDAYMAGMEKKR